jgi:hypothetical protein
VQRTAATPRVDIRADDPSLTGSAGLLLPAELIRRTGLVERLDAAVNAVRPFKERRRGASAGELLVSLSEALLVGGDHLAHLDVLRHDTAGAALRAVAEPPSPPTASQLLRRLTPRQCQAAIAALAAVGNEVDAHLGLDPTAPVTLDLDATRTEVYGRQKEDAAFSYEGKHCLGSQLVTWAERQRILAAELLSGNASAKPTAAGLLRRGLRALPANHGEVRLRGDSDYFFCDLLHACRRQKVRFAVSVPRSRAMWRVQEAIDASAWRPARDMPGAEVAETSYTPSDWKHEPLRLLIRRVRIRAEDISLSSRSRRRRTIPKVQLALALGGALEEVWGYSFILTDLDGDAVEIEQWQRQRAHIEERIKEVKLDCGLFHLPLRTRRANTAWQVATVIATNLMALLSAVVIAGREHDQVIPPDEIDTKTGMTRRPRYRRTATLRRWMLVVPGRIVRGGRRVRLRLPQGTWWADVIIHAYARLRLLPLTT